MTNSARIVSRPTVALMSASFVVCVLIFVPGLGDGLFIGGVRADAALLFGIVLLSFAAFMTAVLDKSLSSNARTLWAVAAALSGLFETILQSVVLTLLYGP